MIGKGKGNRGVGVTQIKEFQITSDADAGLVTVATGFIKTCFLKSSVLRSNGSTTVDFTKAKITSGTAQETTLIPDTVAVFADLDAVGKQVSQDIPAILEVGETIDIFLTGGGSTPVDFTLWVEYESVDNGGFLA